MNSKRLLLTFFLAFMSLNIFDVQAGEEGEKPPEKKDSLVSEPKKPSGSESESGEDKSLYIPIKDMIVPIVQKREIKGFLTVSYSYDCKNKEAKERLLKYLGTIQDHIYWDLYNTLGVVWAPDLYIKTGDLKEKMLKSLNATIDKPEINGILIEDFRFYERENS